MVLFFVKQKTAYEMRISDWSSDVCSSDLVATHCATFCRTGGADGDAKGITCLLVPNPSPGLVIEEYLWTFNMPTDHPRVSFTDVWVPDSARLGPEGGGLAIAQSFVHQNRIRSSEEHTSELQSLMRISYAV